MGKQRKKSVKPGPTSDLSSLKHAKTRTRRIKKATITTDQLMMFFAFTTFMLLFVLLRPSNNTPTAPETLFPYASMDSIRPFHEQGQTLGKDPYLVEVPEYRSLDMLHLSSERFAKE